MWDKIKSIYSWFQGKRTYILAGGSIVGLWWGVYTGSITPHDAIEGTVAALGLGSLRAGIKNDIKKAQ